MLNSSQYAVAIQVYDLSTPALFPLIAGAAVLCGAYAIGIYYRAVHGTRPWYSTLW